MTHNMTVTIEEPLWEKMKKHSEIRWSAVMKKAAQEKLKALEVLEKLTKNFLKTLYPVNDTKEGDKNAVN